jgi:hypothetical protein
MRKRPPFLAISAPVTCVLQIGICFQSCVIFAAHEKVSPNAFQARPSGPPTTRSTPTAPPPRVSSPPLRTRPSPKRSRTRVTRRCAQRHRDGSQSAAGTDCMVAEQGHRAEDARVNECPTPSIRDTYDCFTHDIYLTAIPTRALVLSYLRAAEFLTSDLTEVLLEFAWLFSRFSPSHYYECIRCPLRRGKSCSNIWNIVPIPSRKVNPLELPVLECRSRFRLT